MTAVIAALPRELKRLVQGWHRLASLRRGVLLYEKGGVRAACAGMGVDRAALAVEAVLSGAAGRVDRLISFGLAGGCDPALKAADVRWCSSVVDARSGERFDTLYEGPVLVTGTRIADVAEKLRLRESYGAGLVDMEAAGVARLARARGIGFSALKVVSDAADTALEGMEEYVTPEGAFREVAYGLSVAVRPSRWRGAIAAARASGDGLKTATGELERVLRR